MKTFVVGPHSPGAAHSLHRPVTAPAKHAKAKDELSPRFLVSVVQSRALGISEWPVECRDGSCKLLHGQNSVKCACWMAVDPPGISCDRTHSRIQNHGAHQMHNFNDSLLAFLLQPGREGQMGAAGAAHHHYAHPVPSPACLSHCHCSHPQH